VKRRVHGPVIKPGSTSILWANGPNTLSFHRRLESIASSVLFWFDEIDDAIAKAEELAGGLEGFKLEDFPY
jgi:hypothetical protein